jgi:aryl-alcohol dehydrogenase-like predicted oxidoreductase
VLERCEELGIAFFPWAPIDAGRLAEPGGPVDRIAAAHSASAGQVSLAWLLARSGVMAPIPGTSSVEHLEQNLGAAEIELGAEELAELEGAGE